MHRFYISPTLIKGQIASVQKEELKHLAKVLRLQLGSQVVIFDGLGTEYEGVILSVTPDEARIRLTNPTYFSRESTLNLWLVQGVPKGEKMETIIQKTTELGIKGLVPLETQRSIVKLREETKKDKKEERWQKIAMEAAKQCRRTFIPTIAALQNLQSFLKNLPPEYIFLIPWEEGGKSLKQVFAEQKEIKEGIPIYIFIGPEGGLTEEEVLLAKTRGGIPVTLGPRILRTETAGPTAAAIVMYEWGDLGKC